MKVSVLLATYDEASNIEALIRRIHEILSHRDHEMVVIDDDSPDGTWEIAQTTADSLNTPEKEVVRVFRRTEERGLTSALNFGIQKAKGEVVCWLDCDFQHPPEKLEELLLQIDKGFDAAIGSRYLGQDSGDLRLDREHNSSRWIHFHGLLSTLICKGTTRVLSSNYTDWTSGLIAIRRSIVLTHPLNGNYGEYFMFLLNTLDQIQAKGIEIPYVLGVRERGYSKTSTDVLDFTRKGLRYLKAVAALKFRSAGSNKSPKSKEVNEPS